MRLNTEPITPRHRFWGEISTLAREAFPPEEYLPPEKLVTMAQAEDFDFLALTEQENFVGFLAVKTHGSLAYLFFLAIAPPFRSTGYGSRAIETLKALYPTKTQVVDFEMPDETAPNAAQRIRRRNFYLRNGYQPTGLFLSYLGVDYEIMCMEESFRPEEFKSLMKTIQVEGFHPKYFCK